MEAESSKPPDLVAKSEESQSGEQVVPAENTSEDCLLVCYFWGVVVAVVVADVVAGVTVLLLM